MSETFTVAQSVNTLWALAKHWQIKADNPAYEAEREILLHCAKQLRQRASWVNESLEEQDNQGRAADSAAILDAFQEAGLISSYRIVGDALSARLTPNGIDWVAALVRLLDLLPPSLCHSRIESLAAICNQLTRPTSPAVQYDPF